MTTRKDTLRAALTARARELPSGNPAPAAPAAPAEAPAAPPPEPVRTAVRSGAVGAMGRALGRIATAAEEARAMVAAGDKVVEIDPGLVDPSFVADRLGISPEDHAALTEQVRTRGQQVPILVRPHPTQPGRYQVAYGHRRLRVAAELGRPVRAVVKALSDEDLVVAQGQENSARTDLSYIERAAFAVTLEDRGFARSVIMSALSMEKSQLSRLIAIGRAVPARVLAAIGPAPRTGRPRWAALVEALARPDADRIVEAALAAEDFAREESDARFARLLAALTAPRSEARGVSVTSWTNPAGRAVVRIDRSARRTQLTVDEGAEPEFGAFLVESLPDLYARFTARKSGRAE
ncbi:plasmid partitioning protein RepB [Methylobacterium sp. 4-46]|uniref:plasmid partitioning protein RepB n=1 Tax=unclassified Methylobacterium TaxID=2615210 RepID=UPI000152E375|nr:MULTISPECIES: plasmid partitioning protein RepB [Methylobacterium]ACA19693.1 plasmid partitioning protein RepB [Methylobacterium sp. 4-46]WFT78889.1 plasmid partitioning protein RepB [Methylobacterium nodulans]